jgi:hypothetical protein
MLTKNRGGETLPRIIAGTSKTLAHLRSRFHFNFFFQDLKNAIYFIAYLKRLMRNPSCLLIEQKEIRAAF